MLSLLETFITSRLEMIKFNYSTALPAGPQGVNYRPVKVYPYLPALVAMRGPRARLRWCRKSANGSMVRWY